MPDYMFLLESRLLPEQRAAMMRVQELSAALGFNVYLTGGTVRDLITGASLRDLDFTVEGILRRLRANWKKAARRCCTRMKNCGISKFCLRVKPREAFPRHETTITYGRERGRRFAGRR
jgi:hypothetical protein